MPFKYLRETSRDGRDYVGAFRGYSALPNRRHRLGKAARYDVLEITQIRIDVQRKAVRSHPAADMNPDRGDFAAGSPHPGGAFLPAGLDSKLRQRGDQYLLQAPNVSHNVALPFSQIEDGVADHLARPMIGDIAAAVGAMKCDPGALEQLRGGQQVAVVAAAAHGNDVRMFHDEQLVRDLAALSPDHEVLLHGESVGVTDAAKVAELADGDLGATWLDTTMH